MKSKLIVHALVALSAGMLYAYDPFNPNPSSHDIWEARNSAWQSEQSALNSSVNRDDIGWQTYTQDAWRHQLNANEMEIRMQQNEQRRAAEQRQAEEEQGWAIEQWRNMEKQQRDQMFATSFVDGRAVVEPTRRSDNKDCEAKSSEQVENESASMDEDVNQSSSSVDYYQTYHHRLHLSKIPGTWVNRQFMKERAALWDQLMQGAGDDRGAGFYTRPDADGGTVLYWRGYDYKGRYATHPFRIASTSRANADLSYFNGNPEGEVMLNPNLRESVLRDRFAEFFVKLMGRSSVLAPTSYECEAINKYNEAHGILERVRVPRVNDRWVDKVSRNATKKGK